MPGLLQLHLGVLLLGGAGLFAKLIDLPALDMTAYRAIFAVIFLALFIRYKKQSLTQQTIAHLIAQRLMVQS